MSRAQTTLDFVQYTRDALETERAAYPVRTPAVRRNFGDGSPLAGHARQAKGASGALSAIRIGWSGGRGFGGASAGTNGAKSEQVGKRNHGSKCHEEPACGKTAGRVAQIAQHLGSEVAEDAAA